MHFAGFVGVFRDVSESSVKCSERRSCRDQLRGCYSKGYFGLFSDIQSYAAVFQGVLGYSQSCLRIRSSCSYPRASQETPEDKGPRHSDPLLAHTAVKVLLYDTDINYIFFPFFLFVDFPSYSFSLLLYFDLLHPCR